MILSKNRELGEFAKIRTPEHIARVWAEIENALPGYWSRFVKREVAKAPNARLASKFRTSGSSKEEAGATAVMSSFATAVERYEKNAEKYRSFLDPDAIDEYRDDPNSFKVTSKNTTTAARRRIGASP